MLGDISEENMLGKTASSVYATVHSAQEDDQNYISKTETPINYNSRHIN